MRALVASVALAVALVAPVAAKQSDFFTLRLTPATQVPRSVCGKSVRAAQLSTASRVRAVVALKGNNDSPRRTPFVLAVRRCVDGAFRTTQRVRLDLPARRRSVGTRLRLRNVGDYQVEALLNGDRPAEATAIQYVVVTARNPAPQILSVRYGHFRPRGAESAYDGLELRTLDPDGQVVGLEWTQTSPPPSTNSIGIADGGCGLGGRRNGEVQTSVLPMTLSPGSYRFDLELTSSPCGGSGDLQTVRSPITVDVP